MERSATFEIPAADIKLSADFYATVFEWKIRNDDSGQLSFDDGVGEVSGTWLIGPRPAEPGLVISIMVNDILASIELIIKHGGTIVLPFDKDRNEKLARFADPYGNVFGLYQH